LASNYNISDIDGSLTVTPAGITVLSVNNTAVAGKTYDGKNFASLTGGRISGVLGTDVVNLVQSGTFNSVNVGTQNVTATDTLTGANAANYTLTQPTGLTGVISPAPLTITAGNSSKVYGSTANLGSTNFTSSGLVNGELINNVVLTSAGTVSTASVVGGPYAITANTPTGNSAFLASNYHIRNIDGSLTVTPAVLSLLGINFISVTSKTYDGTNFANITGGSISGVLGTDIVNLLQSGIFDGVNVGIHNVTANYTLTGANAANYTLNQPNGLTGVIGPAPLTIAAGNNAKVYGTTANLGNTNFTTSGLAYGEGISNAMLASTGTVSTASVTGTSYAISVNTPTGNGGFLASNYNISYIDGKLTVTQAGLSVLYVNKLTVASKTYDGTNVANLTGGTISGVLGTDVVSLVESGTFNSVNVGTQNVTATDTLTGANAANYSLTQPTGLKGVISPAPLTIAAGNNTKLYGTTMALDTRNFTSSGLVNGELINNVVLVSSGTANTASVTGGPYAITAKLPGGEGAFLASNYNIAYINGALMVSPAILIIVANKQTSLYGSETPILTGTVTGFVNGDTLANAIKDAGIYTSSINTLSNGITANKSAARLNLALPIGQYGIVNNGLVAKNGNYTFVAAAANSKALTIKPAMLTVTANNQSRLYGAVNPSFTETITGFVNGDNSSVVTGTPIASNKTTSATNVGTSVITGSSSGLSASNYIFGTAVNGKLTITPATLTVTANNQARLYGGVNPTLKGTVIGFVNNDTLANATKGIEVFSTNASRSSNVGQYGIFGKGLVANKGNYTFVQAEANSRALTINPATLTVTANNQTRFYGGVNPTFTETMTGFVNGDTRSVVKGTASGSNNTNSATDIGASVITARNDGLSAINYNFNKLVNGVLTINPAILTVTANNQTRLYGALNPTFTETITGFVNGQTDSIVSGTATGSSVATKTSSKGSVAITASNKGLSAVNYVFKKLVNGVLTIK
jgi:hypothetical protein